MAENSEMEKVISIKNLLNQGVSQYKIASQFGVSRSAILKIKLKQTWIDV